MDESGGRKILIIDGEESPLRALSDALPGELIEVTACDDIEQAVEALVSAEFHMVIVDIELLCANVTEGLELLKFIRQHYCPEVVISSSPGWNEIAAEACRRNSLRHIAKPLTPAKLREACGALGLPAANGGREGE